MTDPLRDPVPDPAAPETTTTVSEPVAPPLDPAAPAPDTVATAPTTVATAPTTDATTTPAATSPYRSRRLHLLAGIRWLIARAFAIALFVGGVAIGYGAFVVTQPPPIVALDPAIDGTATPAVVEEFTAALASNDAAALRSAVPPEPYLLLIAEMERWAFQTVESVETLSTYVDGPRTATELILIGRNTDGLPANINLVVHVDAGEIVSFR